MMSFSKKSSLIMEYIYSDDISEEAKLASDAIVRRAWVKSRFNEETWGEALTYEEAANECADTDFLVQCSTDDKHELYAIAIELLHEELGE